MAAIVVTKANVSLVSGSIERTRLGGAAVGLGESVYLDAAGKWQAAANDDILTAGQNGLAIAFSECFAVNQPIDVIRGGSTINFGPVLVPGETYAVGPVAGQIIPFAEILSGDFTSILGYAIDDSNLVVAQVIENVVRS